MGLQSDWYTEAMYEFHQEEKIEAEQNKKRALQEGEKLSKFLLDILGVRTECFGRDHVLTREGKEYHFSIGPKGDGLYLWWNCPNCQSPLTARIYTKADLGRTISHGYGLQCNECFLNTGVV